MTIPEKICNLCPGGLKISLRDSLSILNVLPEAGGFEVMHDSTSRPALKVTSSADGFGGTVAQIEATGKKGAGGFKLLEGTT